MKHLCLWDSHLPFYIQGAVRSENPGSGCDSLELCASLIWKQLRSNNQERCFWCTKVFLSHSSSRKKEAQSMSRWSFPLGPKSIPNATFGTQQNSYTGRIMPLEKHPLTWMSLVPSDTVVPSPAHSLKTFFFPKEGGRIQSHNYVKHRLCAIKSSLFTPSSSSMFFLVIKSAVFSPPPPHPWGRYS